MDENARLVCSYDMRRSHGAEDQPIPLVALQGENMAGHRHELFAELALPALDDLYRLACRLEREPDRARDLVQEALLVGLRDSSPARAPPNTRATAIS